MAVFKFAWYCLKCMFDVFLVSTGFVPNGFNWKQGLTGLITLFVILAMIFIILISTKVIKLKK